MRIKVEDFINILETEFNKKEEIELVIGSGRKEYPVADIMKGFLGTKLVFATESYGNWKRDKQDMI